MGHIESSEQKRPLSEGMDNLAQVLRDRMTSLIPEKRAVHQIRREDFVQEEFKGAEPWSRDERPTDAYIYEVAFKDGRRTIIVHRKSSGGNPFAGPSFLGGMGLDMRR
jgi:hypothetical protein